MKIRKTHKHKPNHNPPVCLQERLLGVSLTGIMDNRLMSGQQGMDTLEHALTQIKDAAIKVRASATIMMHAYA